MNKIPLAFACLFFMISSNSIADEYFDGYSASNCTAIVGKSTVQLDPTITIPGSRSCISSDSSSRAVTVKVGGRWNIYDKKLKQFMLKKWEDNNIYIEHANNNIAIISYDHNGTYYLVDIRKKLIWGAIPIPRNSYINGPYGKNDIIIHNENNTKCTFSHLDKNDKYVTLYETKFSPCTHSKNIDNDNVVLMKTDTSEQFSFNMNSMVSQDIGVNNVVLKTRAEANCEHLYVGKVFTGNGGIFNIKHEYEVIGFSAERGVATIKSGDYKQEVQCWKIPH